MRRLAIPLIAVVLLAGACGDDDDDDGGAAGSEAQEFAVEVDGKSDNFNGEFVAYFPNALSAHPGDKITFDLPHFNGAPHTVTFGTLVDAAVAKLEQLGPTALPVVQEEAPEALKVPNVFPLGDVAPPPKLNQSAAQPCFLSSGVPPLAEGGGAPACPKTEQPAFDGTQSFFNSGVLMEDGDRFSMTLADDIKPGDYSFMCLIHRGGMVGELTVAADGTDVPSPDEVEAKGQSEFSQLEAALEGPAKAAQAATPDKAFAGTGDPEKAGSSLVAEFGPKTVSIPVGGTVTWNMFAFHSVTFNAKDSDVVLMTKDPDGSFQLSPTGGPAGFTGPAAAFVFPPPANSKPLVMDGGKWDGSGFRSTGVVGSVPPQFISVRQTFTKAGTYTLRCIVHPDMKGEVKVG